MKTETFDSQLANVSGQRIGAGHFGHAAMEGRIEADDLRYAGHLLADGGDHSERWRQVEWRKGNSGVELSEVAVCEDEMVAQVGAAMNDAMANAPEVFEALGG